MGPSSCARPEVEPAEELPGRPSRSRPRARSAGPRLVPGQEGRQHLSLDLLTGGGPAAGDPEHHLRIAVELGEQIDVLGGEPPQDHPRRLEIDLHDHPRQKPSWTSRAAARSTGPITSTPLARGEDVAAGQAHGRILRIVAGEAQQFVSGQRVAPPGRCPTSRSPPHTSRTARCCCTGPWRQLGTSEGPGRGPDQIRLRVPGDVGFGDHGVGRRQQHRPRFVGQQCAERMIALFAGGGRQRHRPGQQAFLIHDQPRPVPDIIRPTGRSRYRPRCGDVRSTWTAASTLAPGQSARRRDHRTGGDLGGQIERPERADSTRSATCRPSNPTARQPPPIRARSPASIAGPITSQSAGRSWSRSTSTRRDSGPVQQFDRVRRRRSSAPRSRRPDAAEPLRDRGDRPLTSGMSMLRWRDSPLAVGIAAGEHGGQRRFVQLDDQATSGSRRSSSPTNSTSPCASD